MKCTITFILIGVIQIALFGQARFEYRIICENSGCASQNTVNEIVGIMDVSFIDSVYTVKVNEFDDNGIEVRTTCELYFSTRELNGLFFKCKSKSEIRIIESNNFVEIVYLLTHYIDSLDNSKLTVNETGYERDFEFYKYPRYGFSIKGSQSKALPMINEYVGMGEFGINGKIKRLRAIFFNLFVTSACDIKTTETWHLKKLN